MVVTAPRNNALSIVGIAFGVVGTIWGVSPVGVASVLAIYCTPPAIALGAVAYRWVQRGAPLSRGMAMASIAAGGAAAGAGLLGGAIYV